MASTVARDLSSVRAERADVGVVRGSIPRGPRGSFFCFLFCFEVGVLVVGRMVVARGRRRVALKKCRRMNIVAERILLMNESSRLRSHIGT